MRKTSTLLICLLAAACSWAQTAPSNPDSPNSAPPNPASDAAAPAQGQQGQHRRFPGVAGTITAVNPDSLVVKTMDGHTAQVTLNDKTQYRKDRQAATLADFKVGDQVMVRGEPSGDNAWIAETVATRSAGGPGEQSFRDALGKRFIIGEIKTISGTQLTIARPDGVTQTIAVDESTSFQKQGESITLADFKPGDHVFGRGEVKNNVFVPAVLNLGDPRMMWGGQGQGQGAHETH
jgi:ribosomal protein L21E